MSTILASERQTPQRLKMIEQALKDQAPKYYRELSEAGKLPEFLKDTDAEMIASYENARIEARMHLPIPKTYLENLQNVTMSDNRVWEETLATFLEFSDQNEDATSTPLESNQQSLKWSPEKRKQIVEKLWPIFEARLKKKGILPNQ